MITGVLARLLVAELQAVWERRGYAWFAGKLNLNIFGIRSATSVAGRWDDLIGVAYELDGWRLEAWPATTDPGTYYLSRPIRPEGAAILCPGQYRGAYLVGVHRGDHDALVQRGATVRVWRDNNRDNILDWQPDSPGLDGWHGINIHRATPKARATAVIRASAGCQVFQHGPDLERLLRLCRQSTARGYGERFTYTLIEAADLSR